MAINLHATATIDVNSANFQQFVQGFNQFQQNLNRVPGQFQQVNRQASMAYVQMQAATAAMMQNVTAAHTRLGSFSALLQKTGYSLRTNLFQPMQNFFARAGATAGSGSGGGGGATSFHGRAATAGPGGGPGWYYYGGAPPHPLAGGATGGGGGFGGAGGRGGVPAGAPGPRGTFGRGAFAMRGMMPFGLGRFNMGSLISGLVGGGALYGLAGLASGAADARRFAMGIGSTTADVKAMELAYGRMFSGKEFLSNISMAQMDPTGPQATSLLGLPGINPQLKQDPAALANQVLLKIRGDVKGMDPFNQGLYYQSHRLEGIMSRQDLRRIADLPEEEFQKQFQDEIKLAQQLKVPDATLKAWTDLNQELKSNANVIETQLLKALGPLTPAIGALSTSLANLFVAITSSDFFKQYIKTGAKELRLAAGAVDALSKGKLGEYLDEKYHSKTAQANRDAFRAAHPLIAKFEDAIGGMFDDKFDKDIRGKNRDYGPAPAGSSIFNRFWKWVTGGPGDNTSTLDPAPGSTVPQLVQHGWHQFKDYKLNLGGDYGIATPGLNVYDTALLKTLAGGEGAGYQTEGPWNEKLQDRPYGKYQYMGKNIPKWTKQFLNQEMTPQQFMADPLAQDKLALITFGGDVARYGLANALSIHHSGMMLADALAHNVGDINMKTAKYVELGLGRWNAQPGVTKVEINIYKYTGSDTGVNAKTSAVPGGVKINQY